MTNPTPVQELTCTTCGAPIKTTAKAGTILRCDCCGATFVVPDEQPVNETTDAQ